MADKFKKSNRMGPHLDKLALAIARRRDISQSAKLQAIVVASASHSNRGEDGASYDRDFEKAYSLFGDDIGVDAPNSAKSSVVGNPFLHHEPGKAGKNYTYPKVSLNIEAAQRAVDDHQSWVKSKVAEIRGRATVACASNAPHQKIDGVGNEPHQKIAGDPIRKLTAFILLNH